MSANYTSQKPDGYQSTRNNIYLERGEQQKERAFKDASALRNLPAQSMQNYGKKTYK